MREGWVKELLKNACKVFTDGNWIESKDQSQEGIRLVQTGNIGFGYFRNKDDNSRFISEETFNRLKCTEILPGDLLVSRLPDPVGKSCIIPELDIKMITSVDCTIIRPRDYLISEYLGYFQMSDEYLKDVKSRVSGTTRSRISRKNLGLIQIPIPPLEEQKLIIAILDQSFEAIDQAKSNIQKNIDNAKELFDSKKEYIFEKLSLEYTPNPVEAACDRIFAGGDAPKDNFSKVKTKEFCIPIIANAVKDNGLYGYTNEARVLKPSITIAARGSGTGHTEFRDYAFFPIVRLIVLIPNTDVIHVEFLMHAIKTLTILRSGSAIPQLTVPMIKGYSIPIPKFDKQLEIVKLLNELEVQLNEYKFNLYIKLESLEELKKSILQKAFTGELTNKEEYKEFRQVAEPSAIYGNN